MNGPVTTTGILLRSHPYSESSRILRFLTPDLGVVSLLGRGIRRGGAGKGGGPETFAEGVLTFHHRPDRDLHTLRSFESLGSSLPLGRELGRFLGASLLAELLLAHVLEEETGEVYTRFRGDLAALGSVPRDQVAGVILAGGWGLLHRLGFLPRIDRCIRCGGPPDGPIPGEGVARFDPAGGGVRCPSCVPEQGFPRIGPVARGHLARCIMGEAPHPLPGVRVHIRFLEAFAAHHLGSTRPFRSFPLLLEWVEREEDGDRFARGGADERSDEGAPDVRPSSEPGG